MAGMTKPDDRITLEEAGLELKRRDEANRLRLERLFYIAVIVVLLTLLIFGCDASGTYDDLGAPDVW